MRCTAASPAAASTRSLRSTRATPTPPARRERIVWPSPISRRTTCRSSSPRCSNNFGPNQYPRNSSRCSSPTRSKANRSRSMATAATCATGFTSKTIAAPSTSLLPNGRLGETYNIAGGNEVENIEIARGIVRTLGKHRVAYSTRRGPPRPRPPLFAQRRQTRHTRLATTPRLLPRARSHD